MSFVIYALYDSKLVNGKLQCWHFLTVSIHCHNKCNRNPHIDRSFPTKNNEFQWKLVSICTLKIGNEFSSLWFLWCAWVRAREREREREWFLGNNWNSLYKPQIDFTLHLSRIMSTHRHFHRSTLSIWYANGFSYKMHVIKLNCDEIIMHMR